MEHHVCSLIFTIEEQKEKKLAPDAFYISVTYGGLDHDVTERHEMAVLTTVYLRLSSV